MSVRDVLARLAWGRATEPETRLWAACTRMVALAVAILVWRALVLAYTKAYAIDEFFYTHVTWTYVAGPESFEGLFTELGTFGGSLIWAPAIALGADDPANMIYVRLTMFPLFAVTAAASMVVAARLESARPWLIALACAFLLFSTRRLLWHALEIRPDGVAIAFAMAALALLYIRRLGDRLAAALSGACVFFACVTTLKAVVYCAPFGLALLADLWSWRKGRPMILRSPLFCVLGGLACVAALAAVLVATGGFGGFWDGYYGRIADHQKFYPALEASRFLAPFFYQHGMLWLLASFGVVGTIYQAIARYRTDGSIDRRWLLVAMLAGAWLSYVLQKAPWAYSLVPGAVFLALFGALGVALLLGLVDATTRGNRQLIGAMVAAGLVVATTSARYRMEPKYRNTRQIAVQRDIHRLTDPGDSAYDLSATYVYRPRGHRFAMVDKKRRRRFGTALAKEVPASLIENETVLFVYDARFHASMRKRALGKDILKNYQRYSNDLYFRGRRWKLSDEPLAATFHAIKSSRYFVHPPEAVTEGRLSIDGRMIGDRVFELTKGEHAVEFERGSFGGANMWIIWLPRNGIPFDPGRRAPRYSLGKYILP